MSELTRSQKARVAIRSFKTGVDAIGLRGYAELNPLTEFRREAGFLYNETLREIRLEAVTALCALTPEQTVLEPDDEDPHPQWPGQSRRRLRGNEGDHLADLREGVQECIAFRARHQEGADRFFK